MANANASSAFSSSYSSGFPSNGSHFSLCLQLTDGSWLCRGSDGDRLHSALLLQGSAGSAPHLQPGQGQQDKVGTGRIWPLGVSAAPHASPCYQFLVSDSFGLKRKGFAEQELNFQSDEKKKGKERRDKLIITAFQLGMWRCCCLSPHTFPSFMPPTYLLSSLFSHRSKFFPSFSSALCRCSAAI